jgi:hypothetical protein
MACIKDILFSLMCIVNEFPLYIRLCPDVGSTTRLLTIPGHSCFFLYAPIPPFPEDHYFPFSYVYLHIVDIITVKVKKMFHLEH